MSKYRVRNFPLHRAVVRGGQKSTDFYAVGDQVDFDDTEAKSYQHLLETEEQYQARQKLFKGKTTKENK